MLQLEALRSFLREAIEDARTDNVCAVLDGDQLAEARALGRVQALAQILAVLE